MAEVEDEQKMRATQAMGNCKWNMAWVGRCKNPAIEGSGFCKDHQRQCSSCGVPATHECDETGKCVCGYPLCDDCEHTIFPDGTNGGVGFNVHRLPDGMKTHCKKTEQRFKPWYARESSDSTVSEHS